MNHVLLNQIHWANSANVHVDRAGYTDSLEANLWRPLSPRTRIAFRSARPNELEEKMRALHSSSALVANFFDYWSVQDAAPLARALQLDAPIAAIDFEAQHVATLPGQPSNLDVCLTLADGRAVGIESKFGEWLMARPAALPMLRGRSADASTGRWSGLGLPACQALAEAIQAGKRSFRYLDAMQLLQHALTLASQPGHHGFALWYLHYAWDVPQATLHARELEAFAAEVGAELGFRALTYQAVYGRLQPGLGARHRDYLAYLERRYFAA